MALRLPPVPRVDRAFARAARAGARAGGAAIDPRPLVSDAYWSLTHPVDRIMGRGRAANPVMQYPGALPARRILAPQRPRPGKAPTFEHGETAPMTGAPLDTLAVFRLARYRQEMDPRRPLHPNSPEAVLRQSAIDWHARGQSGPLVDPLEKELFRQLDEARTAEWDMLADDLLRASPAARKAARQTIAAAAANQRRGRALGESVPKRWPPERGPGYVAPQPGLPGAIPPLPGRGVGHMLSRREAQAIRRYGPGVVEGLSHRMSREALQHSGAPGWLYDVMGFRRPPAPTRAGQAVSRAVQAAARRTGR